LPFMLTPSRAFIPPSAGMRRCACAAGWLLREGWDAALLLN